MEIRIWLGDLGAYNAGTLKGEWLSLPMDADELAAKVALYTRNGEGDYFIADHECPIEGVVGEYSSPTELNELAECLADLDEDNDLPRIKYLREHLGYSMDEAIDSYDDVIFYAGCNLKQVTEQLVDDGCFGEIPETIIHNIDYEAIGRDLVHDGYTETAEGVFYYGR